MTIQRMVREFHEAAGVPVRDEPWLPSAGSVDGFGERMLRVDLLREEWKEYRDAEANDDLVGIADALADIVYVAFGTALVYGIPLDSVLREVHASNMTKTFDVEREAGGKIGKGPGYRPPDVEGVLRFHGFDPGGDS